MHEAASQCYPVIAFDTVERLQSAWDATEHELQETIEDTARVYRWLEYQIKRLPRGVVLLFGRNTPRLEDDLKGAIRQANRGRSLQSQIVFEVKELGFLNTEEQRLFFEHRIKEYPDLKTLMTSHLANLLLERTQGNPLLLDIAIQTLLETRNQARIIDALQRSEPESGITEVEDALLAAYMQSGSSARQALLYYLMVARNGLFDELLQELVPADDYPRLRGELAMMEKLPFIKWRDISVLHPGEDERIPRRTYFFHDAMYAICERVRIVGLEDVRAWSGTIAHWYDRQIEQHAAISTPDIGTRRPDAVADLLIESLPYRMRADPPTGYQWYLEQSDRAIRSAETGLDMRLRDAMAQFVVSAYKRWQTGELPVSKIDDEIIRLHLPSLVDDFRLDSALLWVKRFSVRGKNKEALDIAQNAVWVRDIYRKNSKRYLTSYAEFRLWHGQALMYGREPVKALGVFADILDDLERLYPLEKLKRIIANEKLSAHRVDRLCYVAGRCHNNMGYIYWMNTGQYWLAITEFQRAIAYFELAGLVEEQANSSDNIGRVYAMLGFSWESFIAIQEGLNIRHEQVHLPYRKALSLNSLALHYLQFDKVHDAIETVGEALTIFRRVGIERGEALALTTRGLAFRIKAEAWRDQRTSIVQALEDLDAAEADLRAASRVFARSVEEPLRRMHVENELACCYRARYLLLREKGDSEKEKNETLKKGLRFFESAHKLAEGFGFQIEKLDNLQDRAVLYKRAGDYDNAIKHLEQVRQQIPKNHKFSKDQKLTDLPPESRVDAYFKLMGMIELLHGAVIYDRGLSVGMPQETPTPEVILEMMEHYVLAVAYFDAVAGTSFTNRRTSDRMYRRLKKCEKSFLLNLRDREIPRWIERYHLPAAAVQTLVNEIFRLLLPFGS